MDFVVIGKILLAIVEAVGIDPLLKWIAANAPQDRINAVLDAEYAAARAAADEEAKRILAG